MKNKNFTQEMIEDLNELYSIDAVAELEEILVDEIVVAKLRLEREEKINDLLDED